MIKIRPRELEQRPDFVRESGIPHGYFESARRQRARRSLFVAAIGAVIIAGVLLAFIKG